MKLYEYQLLPRSRCAGLILKASSIAHVTFNRIFRKTTKVAESFLGGFEDGISTHVVWTSSGRSGHRPRTYQRERTYSVSAR